MANGSSSAASLFQQLAGFQFVQPLQHQDFPGLGGQSWQLGQPYPGLLQFFLNHRTFLRSRIAERVGKSPKELMTGEKHPQWLELLGFQRFQPT
jgi:hypothetical protein